MLYLIVVNNELWKLLCATICYYLYLQKFSPLQTLLQPFQEGGHLFLKDFWFPGQSLECPAWWLGGAHTCSHASPGNSQGLSVGAPSALARASGHSLLWHGLRPTHRALCDLQKPGSSPWRKAGDMWLGLVTRLSKIPAVDPQWEQSLGNRAQAGGSLPSVGRSEEGSAAVPLWGSVWQRS